MKTRYLLCLLAMLALLWQPDGSLSAAGQEKITLFREHFQDLDNWQDFYFPRIGRHSTYTIERRDGVAVLRAESNASASAIVHRTVFDVRKYPLARWRWKVQNVYQAGNGRQKEGDDYPIRIYVMFEYRPERASAWERLQYGLAKKLYGQYPPHSSLSYVWASKEEMPGYWTAPSPTVQRWSCSNRALPGQVDGRTSRSTCSPITGAPSGAIRRGAPD